MGKPARRLWHEVTAESWDRASTWAARRNARRLLSMVVLPVAELMQAAANPLLAATGLLTLESPAAAFAVPWHTEALVGRVGFSSGP